VVVRDRKCSVTFLSVVLPQHLVVILSCRLPTSYRYCTAHSLPPPQAIQPVMSMPVRRLKFDKKAAEEVGTLPISGFSVTGYIRTGTGVKQTEVDCELTDDALSSRY
jgi:hypothetical protein